MARLRLKKPIVSRTPVPKEPKSGRPTKSVVSKKSRSGSRKKFVEAMEPAARESRSGQRKKSVVAKEPADKERRKTRMTDDMTNTERSSYFARREAAKVLRSVLEGDARLRAIGSIKSLIYGPSVRNKKGTFALVCQTLKHLPVLKDVLEASGVLSSSKWKNRGALLYVVTYDILLGQPASLAGDAEKFLLQKKDALQSALAQILVRKKVKHIQDLMALYHIPDVSKPRYVRVNTLKLDMESAIDELGKQNMVQKDDMVPDLLILPPGTDLHNHPLVKNGSVFMQGKASSMVAVALSPKPGWQVLDACSAPGNKTVHLAALMKGKGKITACELNKDRVKRLKDTIKLAGTTIVKALHGDFLELSPKDPSYSKVRAILLDPSCSGSGMAVDRLDHLLPSYRSDNADSGDTSRLTKLAAFQKRALEHALSFPEVERVVYSTCSIHQIENEDVIRSVLPLANSLGFQLATPFPPWPRRGLPGMEGSEHLLRADPVKDKEGFFIALFVRNTSIDESEAEAPAESKYSSGCEGESSTRKKTMNKNKFVSSFSSFPRMSRILLHLHLHARKMKTQKKL